MASSSMKSAAKANLLGKRKLEDDLEIKPILRKHTEISYDKETRTRKTCSRYVRQFKRKMEFLERKSNLISVKEVARRKRTLFVLCLPGRIEISDIIDFFKNVGEVVHVQLILKGNGTRLDCCFVEFASADQANQALQKKNAEYMLTRRIFLVNVDEITPYHSQPKYYMDHKVWSRPESLPKEEDETPYGYDEEVLVFVANLSPQTKLFHIINFFKHYGGLVSVRLIVNHEGKHVGYGFVEFVSSEGVKKAMKYKNGAYFQNHKIFLHVVKTAPYPPPPPNCTLAERLCYEDYLRQESLMIEDDETVEELDATPDFVEAVSVRKKTLFVDHLSPLTEISHIINFFKDVGEVVHVRLNVDEDGNHVGNGFVEFASSNQAKKALKKKNNEYLHDCKIVLSLPKTAPYPPAEPEYWIDHKVWYEDYLRQKSLLIEDEADDETPYLVEEVAIRKKTLFIAKIALDLKLGRVINFFELVGEVVSARLIANHEGKHVGCGFVEFASINEAKKALKYMNGEKIGLRKHDIFLDVVQIAPYPLRPKHNLAEKLWYEDYLGRESLVIEEEDDDDLETKLNLMKQKVPIFSGKKITFPDDD